MAWTPGGRGKRLMESAVKKAAEQDQLYLVKRANAPIYHGGYYSDVTPKLYFKQWASMAAQNLNWQWRRSRDVGDPTSPVDGNWIIVPVSLDGL